MAERSSTPVGFSLSEGIFVYAPGAIDVSQGDRVRVTGEVTEFFDLTELTNVSAIAICGSASVPTPTDVLLPVATLDEFERYEGMLVRFPQSLVIVEYFNFDRFGEIVLAQPLDGLERPFQPTSYIEPGPAVDGTEVTIMLAAGDDVTCTYNNLRRPQIRITKYADTNGNGERDADEAGLEGQQVFLYLADGNGGWQQIQPREVRTNGRGIANYTSLEPGVDHLVCEEDRTGWSTTEPANPIEHDGKICQVVADLVYGEVRRVSFGNREEPVAQTLYRARQVGARVWIERNVEEAGLGDFDPDGNGWALVGRTNGAADNGELRDFFVEEGVPYAIVFNRSNNQGDRCILLTPRSLDVVKKGQTRLMTTVEDPVACPVE